jgi:hypothetical protein
MEPIELITLMKVPATRCMDVDTVVSHQRISLVETLCSAAITCIAKVVMDGPAAKKLPETNASFGSFWNQFIIS